MTQAEDLEERGECMAHGHVSAQPSPLHRFPGPHRPSLCHCCGPVRTATTLGSEGLLPHPYSRLYWKIISGDDVDHLDLWYAVGLSKFVTAAQEMEGRVVIRLTT